MTEQQIPARIWARNPNGKCVVSFTIGDFDYKTPYIRSDIAERMAEALERSLSWLTSYPGDGALGAYEHARSALSAFRSATQDTEANR